MGSGGFIHLWTEHTYHNTTVDVGNIAGHMSEDVQRSSLSLNPFTCSSFSRSNAEKKYLHRGRFL
jgi:hypothetical protein